MELPCTRGRTRDLTGTLQGPANYLSSLRNHAGTDDRPARAVPHAVRIAELSNPVHVREGWVERTADVCVDSRAVHVLRRRVVGRGEHGIVEGFGRDPDPHVS